MGKKIFLTLNISIFIEMDVFFMSKLSVGDHFPDFSVITSHAVNTCISSLADGQPVMILFLRYIGCTVCRMDVHDFIHAYAKFQEKGVGLLLVMQSKPEIVQRDLANEDLPFPIICDVSQDIYKELDVVPAKSMAELVGDGREAMMNKLSAAKEAGFDHGDYEGNEQQLPAFFYLDKDLTVLDLHYAKNISDIPSPDELLEKIK